MRIPQVPRSASEVATRARQVANFTVMLTSTQRLDLQYVVEYPKCGGSWIRRQLEAYRSVPYFSNDRLISQRSIVQLHVLPKPFIRKPIVVVRDPRDMLVSFFYYESQIVRSKRGQVASPIQADQDLRRAFTEYVASRYMGKSFPGYTFSRFFSAWQSRDDKLLVRYEDHLQDPIGGLGRILQFTEAGAIDQELLFTAVESTSFEAMSARLGERRERGTESTQSFVRKGVAGDWQRHMTVEAAKVICRYEEPALRALGYAVDDSWTHRLPTLSGE